MPNQSTRNPSGDALRADASQGHGVRRVGAPGSQLGTAAEEARWDRTSHRALHCPSWDRTRTLLIQSQACCQLHQGAGACKITAYALVAKSFLNISRKLSGFLMRPSFEYILNNFLNSRA